MQGRLGAQGCEILPPMQLPVLTPAPHHGAGWHPWAPGDSSAAEPLRARRAGANETAQPLLGFTPRIQSAGGALRGCFMEGTKGYMRCWEPGGQPGLPVCSGEPGRGHSACKARGSGSDAPALTKANGESRETKVSTERLVAPQAPPPAAALAERYWRGGPRCSQAPITPAKPLTPAHTTQCKRRGPGREPKGGERRQQPLPGSLCPSLVWFCLPGAWAGVQSGGSQPQRLRLLRAARPAVLS